MPWTRLLMTTCLVVLGALAVQTLLAADALANGGTVQVASQPAGPYSVSVFTSPNPIRVGTVDVSVLVQRAGSEDSVPDAQVAVTAEPLDHPGARQSYEATHEQATNKLYYAANVNLPTEGRWKLDVQLSGAAGEGSVSFQVDATPGSPLDNPLLLVLLLAAPLLAVGVWVWRVGGGTRTADRDGG